MGASLCFPVMARNNDTFPVGATMVCANLIYAGGKTSQCFSDRFLQRIQGQTRIRIEPRFRHVRLDSAALFNYPFAVMSGDGSFRLSDAERTQLRHYVTHGGFLLVSASCSDVSWAQSFHAEFARTFPGGHLVPLSLEHPLFRIVYKIVARPRPTPNRRVPCGPI